MSKREDLSTFVFSKVPPQAIPLEEAVLGALMIDNGAFQEIEGILSAECFYLDAHQDIFQAIKNLAVKSQPIDVLTVPEELKVMKKLEAIGGPYYLVELTNKIASSANIEYHTRLIAQKFIQRELIRVSNECISKAYEDIDDVFQLVDDAAQKLAVLESPFATNGGKSAQDLALDELKRLEASMDLGSIVGTPTGFLEFDLATKGLEASNKYLFAGRPGMGKTALVLQLLNNIAIEQGYFVGMFSLEMSATQLVQRLGAAISETRLDEVRSPGQMNPEQLVKYKKGIASLGDASFRIDDTAGISVQQVRSTVRTWKKKHPEMKGIIIDYIQLMTGGGKPEHRELEISAISRGLKAIAKEFNIWVIELSQLSRAVEVRGGAKIPQLSDLRESGSLEQDADLVTFIYRPEYYGILEDEHGQSLRGLAELIIAKNRHGVTKRVKTRFDGDYMTFKDWNAQPDFNTKILQKVAPMRSFDDDLPFDEDIPWMQ